MPDTILEMNYDSADLIPDGFASLFTEADGKFALTGVSGMKTPQDVANVQEALRKEREDHKAAKDALTPWTTLGELKDIQAKLDRIPELEAAAEGKLDDTKLAEMVENRLTQRTAPLQRDLEAATARVTEQDAEIAQLRGQIVSRDRNDLVRAAAIEMKVVATAIPDVEMIAASYLEQNEAGDFITKADISGITPGVDVKQFLKEMQKIRPHWWPASQGGGAGGANGLGAGEPNPWTSEAWNMTKQGAILQSDRGLAERLAKAAGTTIGGQRPAPKAK